MLDVKHSAERPGLRHALLACLVAALGACTTSSEMQPINADEAVVQELHPDRAWRVVEGGSLRGYVVRFADANQPGRCCFSVRNELQQELGSIDELGRVWRFVPHQREAQWVCTSTLTRGAARLLGTGEASLLEPVELDSLLQSAPETH